MLKLRIKAGAIKPGATISTKIGSAGMAVSDLIEELNNDSSSKYPKGTRVFVNVSKKEPKGFNFEYLPLTDSASIKLLNLNSDEEKLITFAKGNLKNSPNLESRIKSLKGVIKSLNLK